MRVTEIFQSLQGEGPYTGHRAIFIRLHGCNLKCTWCDSRYAWSPGSIFYEQTVDQIMTIIDTIIDVRHVVITGGEPTIQMDALMELTAALRKEGRFVTIETNGTTLLNAVDFDQIMVSPKTIAVADTWFDTCINAKNVELKFVVNPENLDNVLVWAKGKGLTKLILMPQGSSPQEVLTGSLMILDALMEGGHDHIICPRTHILLGLK